MNAITDAIGVRDLAMPATAETVWRAIAMKKAA
jgi:CO/xanthine dehydrogenase Mo-binding subunit